MRRPLLTCRRCCSCRSPSAARICTWPYQPHPAVAVKLDPERRATSASTASAAPPPTSTSCARCPNPIAAPCSTSSSAISRRRWCASSRAPRWSPSTTTAIPRTVNAAGFVRPEDHLWQLGEIFARGNTPKLIGALWTPPAWMKTTGQECCGGTLLPGMDAELAEFFSVYLSYLEEAGHPLDSLSIQNEPEAASPWDANTYTPPHMANVLEAVAQRIVADGHATRLHGPDNAIANFVPIFLPALLAKPTAASLFDAVGFHLYGSTWYPDSSTVAPDVEPVATVAPEDMPLWMTEFSNTTFEGYGSFDEGIWQAELIHESLVAGVSMYVMWNLYRPGGPGEAAIVIPTTARRPRLYGDAEILDAAPVREVRATRRRANRRDERRSRICSSPRSATTRRASSSSSRSTAPRSRAGRSSSGATLLGAPRDRAHLAARERRRGSVRLRRPLRRSLAVATRAFGRDAELARSTTSRAFASRLTTPENASAREHHAQRDAIPAEGREPAVLEECDQPAHGERRRDRRDREAERDGHRPELLEQVRRAGLRRHQEVLQQLVARRRRRASGRPSRNENSAASRARRPSRMPPAIVIIERDVPGHIAAHWKNPIASARCHVERLERAAGSPARGGDRARSSRRRRGRARRAPARRGRGVRR